MDGSVFEEKDEFRSFGSCGQPIGQLRFSNPMPMDRPFFTVHIGIRFEEGDIGLIQFIEMTVVQRFELQPQVVAQYTEDISVFICLQPCIKGLQFCGIGFE